MKKEERLAKKQKEDQALNRVLWWFGGAVVLEFFLLLLNRFYINFDAQGAGLAQGIFRFLQVLAWVCLALAVVCVLWWAAEKKRKGKTFLPGICALTATSLFLCAFVAGMWKELGVQFLYVTVPVVAVLALIYYLYQREFFLVALLGGVTLFSMWAYRKLIYVNKWLVYGIFIAAAVMTVAAVVFFAVLQGQKGRLGKVRILSKRANYLPLYIAGAVTVLSLVFTVFLGATVAYVCLIGTVAWLFGVAVYYTVRLM